MRSALLLISGLAFLVIVSVIATRLFDHFSEQKEEMMAQLPKPPPKPEVDGLPVRIDGRGALFIDGTAVSESELEARLVKLAMSQGSRRVVLDPDENAPQQAVTRVLDACAAAGIGDVSFTSPASADAP